jgi:ribosomal protein S18 acetylase RimI-like enzyme
MALGNTAVCKVYFSNQRPLIERLEAFFIGLPMMKHVLDNPAWNALISGNANFANGNEQAKYFDIEISPFIALKDNSADDFKALHQLLPDNRIALFVTPAEMPIPAPWTIQYSVKGYQMLFSPETVQGGDSNGLISLTETHIPQMLALTKLTNPGPFASRTIEFGHYRGVFDGNKLVAMAGQRLHAGNYAEISAVCTHPDHTGKGYARQLLLDQAKRIKQEGNTPFLHVKDDNERAIKVYESLGFAIRHDVYFYVLDKAKC